MSGKPFSKHVYRPADADFIANSATVEADEYFISIITDPHEGHAHMTLPVAREVYRVLGEAIAFCHGLRTSSAEHKP